MNSEIEQALNFDALAEAERITGVSYKKDEGTTMLGMLLMQDNSARKKVMLEEIGDVHFNIGFDQYVAIAERLGFKLLTSEPVDGTKDIYNIYWRDGVLLTLESYWDGRSVNMAKAYFNFRGPRNSLRHCSSSWAGGEEDPVWAADRDMREGLKFSLGMMQDTGELLKTWVKRPFLWLLTYNDSKSEGYDYNAINAARISKFPADVQKAITP